MFVDASLLVNVVFEGFWVKLLSVIVFFPQICNMQMLKTCTTGNIKRFMNRRSYLYRHRFILTAAFEVASFL